MISGAALANVALVNNAQREHQEFMQNVEAVAIENGSAIRALPADGVAVFLQTISTAPYGNPMSMKCPAVVP